MFKFTIVLFITLLCAFTSVALCIDAMSQNTTRALNNSQLIVVNIHTNEIIAGTLYKKPVPMLIQKKPIQFEL